MRGYAVVSVTAKLRIILHNFILVSY